MKVGRLIMQKEFKKIYNRNMITFRKQWEKHDKYL